MRPFHVTLGFAVSVLLGAVAGCTSTSSIAAGSAGSVSSSSSTSGAGSSGVTTGTGCLDLGLGCEQGGPPCCDGVCTAGTCQLCTEPSTYAQCTCGGVPVGPPDGCNLGESCGLDAGLPDGGDGGACQCVQVTENYPCP